MQIRDILQNQIMITPETDLQEAVKKMIENNLFFIPVVESLAHKNTIGVVTAKSICRRSIAEGLNPLRMSVGRVMNCEYSKVSPNTTIEECLEILESNNINYIVVNDEDNVCRGLVTIDEIKSYLSVQREYPPLGCLPEQTEMFLLSEKFF